MAMFFSPSLTALIGNRAGWPGHSSKLPRDRDTVTARLAVSGSQVWVGVRQG
jgi:hypothetical protein